MSKVLTIAHIWVRRHEHYIFWLALIIVAMHSYLGDYSIKAFMTDHFAQEKKEGKRIDDMTARIQAIEKRHAAQDIMRFKNNLPPHAAIEKEDCK